MPKRSEHEDVSDAELRSMGLDPQRYVHINDPLRLHEHLRSAAPPTLAAAKLPRRAPPGQQRGAENERRVLKICHELEAVLDWLLPGSRACTPDEDHMGIDIVVPTVDGELHLQVKSSVHGVRRFKRRRPRAEIGIVLVKQGITHGKLRAHVIWTLGRLRDVRRKRLARAASPRGDTLRA